MHWSSREMQASCHGHHCAPGSTMSAELLPWGPNRMVRHPSLIFGASFALIWHHFMGPVSLCVCRVRSPLNLQRHANSWKVTTTNLRIFVLLHLPLCRVSATLPCCGVEPFRNRLTLAHNVLFGSHLPTAPYSSLMCSGLLYRRDTRQE